MLNGREIVYDEDEAFAMVVRVAAGERSLDAIAEWFASRIEAS